ncbi:MAG: CBS domain-containing protein [Saprospiraceae bacterium]|nr:CBS domain-containing protein [Saprospiraceae bacterium]
MNTEMPIKKIKTSKIIYVKPSDSMLKVEEILESFNIHHILVLENELLVGIISKSDLLKLYQSFASKGIIPVKTEIMASEMMTPNPITLDTEDSVGLAADIFLSTKIHSVPVLNGDKLSGIITSHDLIKYSFR